MKHDDTHQIISGTFIRMYTYALSILLKSQFEKCQKLQKLNGYGKNSTGMGKTQRVSELALRASQNIGQSREKGELRQMQPGRSVERQQSRGASAEVSRGSMHHVSKQDATLHGGGRHGEAAQARCHGQRKRLDEL